jgi:hypothetical protein
MMLSDRPRWRVAPAQSRRAGGLRDQERKPPGLDQLADPGERVDRAAGIAVAEPHAMLLRAAEVGDRHDVLRTPAT